LLINKLKSSRHLYDDGSAFGDFITTVPSEGSGMQRGNTLPHQHL